LARAVARAVAEVMGRMVGRGLVKEGERVAGKWGESVRKGDIEEWRWKGSPRDSMFSSREDEWLWCTIFRTERHVSRG